MARINAIAGIIAAPSRLLYQIARFHNSFLGGINSSRLRFGLVPSAMGGQVGRAIKDLQRKKCFSCLESESFLPTTNLFALGALVLDVNDAGTTVLGQHKGIIVDSATELAHVVSNLVVNAGQDGLGLLCDFDHVKSRINVAFAHHQLLVVAQFANDGARNWTYGLLIDGHVFS